jgi:membrane fusion protein, multidrug efflux system
MKRRNQAPRRLRPNGLSANGARGSMRVWTIHRCLLLGLLALTWAPAATTADSSVRAQLTPRSAAVISSEIGGRIRELRFLEGTSFERGAILLVIDDSLQRAQVERARAVLTGAERTFTANQRLHALNSIGQIELDLSEAEVAKARAELAYVSAMLAKCEIRAPFGGRMAEQRVRSEEFVQPGQVLFEIVDRDTPQIDFIAPSKWLSWLSVGQSFELFVEETGKRYAASIERIGAKVDPVSQSVKIVGRVTADAPDLIAGMSGTVQLQPPSP